MDIQKFIKSRIRKQGEIRTSDIVKKTGFSRVYVNRFLNELERAGEIVLIGKANQARYVSGASMQAKKAREAILRIRKIIRNEHVSEDVILDEIKQSTGIFKNLPVSVARILDYAFTEMVNNAIEHSRSKKIEITMSRGREAVEFVVFDAGIGIFRNIMKTRGLRNEMEAIQDLLKGKQTTAPEAHTGEGIFFTSKAGDAIEIKSGKKKLIFDNLISDIFIREVKDTQGTKVFFRIGLRSKRKLDIIFRDYSGDAFEFGKTRVIVDLYKTGDSYISRSQARRITFGLERFKEILLDFERVETVGQGFTDEIFRVWRAHHPGIRIAYQNANENVEFMIKRSLAEI